MHSLRLPCIYCLLACGLPAVEESPTAAAFLVSLERSTGHQPAAREERHLASVLKRRGAPVQATPKKTAEAQQTPTIFFLTPFNVT